MSIAVTFAQQSLPQLDSMYWIMLASRVLHLVAAAILIGGLFYLWRVVAPSSASAPSDSADASFGGRRAAWAMWVGVATLVLIATGLFNFMQIVRTYDRMGSGYHAMFGTKFVLSLVLFALAALLAGKTNAALKLRQKMKFWLGACVAIGVAIVVVAGVMRSYPHVPKLGEAGQPLLVAPSNEP